MRMLVPYAERMWATARALMGKFTLMDALDVFLVVLAECTVYAFYMSRETNEIVVHMFMTQAVSLVVGFTYGLVYFRLMRDTRCPACDKPVEYVEL